MENQPAANQPAITGRQWFRLASLARLESLAQASSQAPPTTAPALAPPSTGAAGVAAPAPAPAATAPTQAPVPRIPLPFQRLPAEPVQAQPQPQNPPPSNLNGAPPAQAQPQPPRGPQATPTPLSAPQVSQSVSPPPPPPPSPKPRVPSRTATPLASPRDIRPESPKIQSLRPIKTPSPWYPDPEPEPKPSPQPSPTKNMFIQQQQQGNSNRSVKTIASIDEKPQVNVNQSHNNERKEIAAAPNGTEAAAAPTWKNKKNEEGEMKVITMAGENMGAYMELGTPHGQHINRKQQQHGYQLQDEDDKSEDKNKEKGKKSMAAGKGKPMEALVNSNVQSINNCIIFRSSCTQQSPGVHMTLVSQRQPKHEAGKPSANNGSPRN